MSDFFPMTDQYLASLTLFAFASSITPGPNNLMLMASGVNFGLRRTLPHMLGIGAGFAVLLLVVGTSLVGVFDKNATVRLAFQVACATYMLWLAYQIATTGPIDGQANNRRPITFLQAAAFQWVNPKAWAMAVTATSLYADENSVPSVLFVAMIFVMINVPTVASWAYLGEYMARHLEKPGRLRVFNGCMALLLLASLVPLFIA